MSTYGLKISDGDEYITVTLIDILDEITYGSNLNWIILDLDGIGPIGKNLSTPDFIKHVANSKDGVPISWEDLNTIFNNMCVFDITIIASQNKNILHRYNTDQEMQQVCDIVIQFFDSSWWEVFSKDIIFINNLAKKFQKVEFIN
jgi:hypothetical protein